MAGAANSWMGKYTNPSKKSFMKWMSSQKNQFNPMISTLTNQANRLNPTNDPVSQMYSQLLGRVPGQEQITQAYAGKGAEFANLVKGMDFGKGAAGVADIVKGAAGAIGAEAGAAADVAGAAGTISGMGGQAGNLYSNIISAGGFADLGRAETEAKSGAEDKRMSLMEAQGQAFGAARDKQMEAFRNLATARQQKMGATQEPFSLANMIMQFQENKKSLRGSGRGGTAQGPPTPVNGRDAFAAKNPGLSEADVKRYWNMKTGY